MRFSPAPLVVVSAVAASLACAQTAAKDPAAALEVPTQSRAAKAQLSTADAVAAALEARGDSAPPLAGGPEVVVALEQVVNSPAHPAARRIRAVQLLGQLEDPAAAKPVESLLRDKNAEPRLRAAAAVAFAHRSSTAAVGELKAMLSDPAPEVRIGAARGLAAVASPEARSAIEERLASEPEREVREALQHALVKTEP